MPTFLRRLFDVIKKSSFVVALIAFALTNLAVGYALKGGCQDAPEHGLFWWKTWAYRTHPESPPVVLMGSCLLSSALTLGDARCLNKTIDPAVDQRCYVLEQALQRRLNRALLTFSYSLSGMMISDAFAVAKANFTAAKHPEVLVVCLAPRDFLDNGLQNVLASPTAKYMSRLSSSQIFPDADLPQRTVLEQIIGVLPLLQHRQDILCYEKSGERIAIDLYFADVLHRNIGIKPQKFSDIELALCGCQNVRVGEDSVYPTNAVSLDFADNELEYRLRYLPYHRDALLKQLFYLDSLLHYCREIGTRVAVVNMPLLPENIALLPNGAYAEYLESIGRKAQVNNAVFLDLNRPDLFNRSDFKTPVHLNGAGGIKFSNALSALIEITLRENGQVAWLGGICSLNVMRTHLRHQ